MDKNLQEQDLFDKYLQNTLSISEKERFELDLEQDSELKSRFELFKDIVIGIQAVGQEEIKSFIKEIDSEMKDPIFFSFRIRKIVSIAAVLIVLVGIASYFAFFNQQIDTQPLFSQYYSPYQNDLIYYSRGAIIPEELKDIDLEEYNKIVNGMRFYDSRDYENAYLVLNKSYKNGVDNLYILFYLSMCQLITNREAEAINSLKLIAQDIEHPYYDDALWYISLTYLKMGDTRESKKSLKKLIKVEDTPYSKKASDLLKQLNNTN